MTDSLANPLVFGKGRQQVALLQHMANRHGLVAGATGTGKTITVRVLAEQFSLRGVPVFVADVKGDLSGLAQPGGDHQKVRERVAELGLEDFQYQANPLVFWDVFGELGHPVRTTISEMGPLLLGRLLNLNEIQSGVLTMIFRIADDQGLLLLDLKDLRAMVQHVSDHAGEFRSEYGNISVASTGAIQRSLLGLEEQGGQLLFGDAHDPVQDQGVQDVHVQGLPGGAGVDLHHLLVGFRVPQGDQEVAVHARDQRRDHLLRAALGPPDEARAAYAAWRACGARA